MDETNSITHKLLNSRGPVLIIASELGLLFLGTQFVRHELHANIVVTAGVMLVVVGAFVSALTYLRGNKASFQDRSVTIHEKIGDEQIALIVNALKKTISNSGTATPPSFELTAPERAELLNSWKESISGETYKESSRIKDFLSPTSFEPLKQELKATKLRLLDEVAALTRRGNLNLVIGGFTTILAVVLLGYVVLTAESTPLPLTAFFGIMHQEPPYLSSYKYFHSFSSSYTETA